MPIVEETADMRYNRLNSKKHILAILKKTRIIILPIDEQKQMPMLHIIFVCYPGMHRVFMARRMLSNTLCCRCCSETSEQFCINGEDT